MTDEIKVTIAAYACILLLHRQHDFYPRLESVVVYPDVYPVPVTRQGPGNTVIETHEVRAGESWQTGAVVLSWNHLRHRPTDPVGGHNVVLKADGIVVAWGRNTEGQSSVPADLSGVTAIAAGGLDFVRG